MIPQLPRLSTNVRTIAPFDLERLFPMRRCGSVHLNSVGAATASSHDTRGSSPRARRATVLTRFAVTRMTPHLTPASRRAYKLLVNGLPSKYFHPPGALTTSLRGVLGFTPAMNRYRGSNHLRAGAFLKTIRRHHRSCIMPVIRICKGPAIPKVFSTCLRYSARAVYCPFLRNRFSIADQSMSLSSLRRSNTMSCMF